MKLDSFSLIKFSLAIVYIWFGFLKIIGASPLSSLITNTYPMMPEPLFISVLGIFEAVIGLLLISSKTLKIGLILMWLQMAGIFFGVILSPSNYFQNLNPLLLSANGEFVVKNLVLLAASYYLFEKISKLKKPTSSSNRSK